ncbi:MAG: septation protein A [Aquabacterium sp.]|jgi:intracellular septation protein|uniref:septation protein A n=1 Tax=Aquabacterium sp. TaxID=1872578 RepID=UPI001B56EBD6|nr:septation protein A [Aquabacterium sp.]MBP7133177.1 septation protein A [Aquabacterium sp.]MBP9062308.1 septation protein A [Aquabacterium sp.]MDQ5926304.1 Inner rane-spanning protein YciB [Pseudomonadota bacterium]
MKIFFDLLPIILFFASYKWAGSNAEQAAQWLNHYLGFAVSGGSVGVTEAPVLLATVVVVVATMLQILVLKALGKRVDKMLWAGLAVVVVLGGLTLWFHDETFIKWKPTVIYWLMATGFLITEIVLGKKMLRQMMGGQVDVPEAVWRNLGWAWVLFFAGMGVLNLWVAFNFPTDTWVSFKMWGSLGLTLVFTLAQGVYLSRHMAPTEAPAESGKQG